MNEQRKVQKFDELLRQYMRRIRASAGDVAEEIGVSRQTVYNWINGISFPKTQQLIIDCAKFLLLDEKQTVELIKSVSAGDLLLATEETKEKISHIELSYQLFQEHINSSLKELCEIPGYPIMAHLIQTDIHELAVHNAILKQAKNLYGSEKVLHVFIPPDLSGQNSAKNRCSYFRDLAQQCGFEQISGREDCSDTDFSEALRDCILTRERTVTVLLVSNLEKGLFEFNYSLAKIIRSLSDRFERHFHVIICGGTGLDQLTLGNGVMSLLNHAQRKFWPEWDMEKLLIFAKYEFKLRLTEKIASRILKVSGGHFQLMKECLILLRRNSPYSPAETEFEQELSQSECIWRVFTQFCKPEQHDKLCHWLQNIEIACAQPYIMDDILRDLFWKNMVRRQKTGTGDKLCWRSRLIQQVGKTILKCDENKKG